MKDVIEIANRMKAADTWNADDCLALCEYAGMEAEYEAADGETFEQVVTDAATKLGVEIF